MTAETESDLRGAKILVVDDVAANRNLLCQTLEAAGYSISAAPSGEVALQVARADRPDLVLLDILLPGLDGFEVCRRLQADELTRRVPVVFITARDEASSVMEGFQVGGVDYVTKPFQTGEVLARVRTHLRLSRLTRILREKNDALSAANERLQTEINRRQEAEQAREASQEQLSVYASREARRWGIAGFVGRSPTLRRILDSVRRLQEHERTSVLITGESGTGKELIARAIHFGGGNAEGPFIPVNCPAIPGELAESMLFGHRRGAFSGAHSDHKGCFELADGGTLFLDEISDMPLALQSKLLRVLDDGLITPLGATQGRRVDVRVLAASNADFLALIAAGRFRQDLYFRLARFIVEVPPLRDRREDIPLLVEHFLDLFGAEMGLARPGISIEALAQLEAYSFPGNVRELKNILERALIESGGEVRPVHLQLPGRSLSTRARPADGGASGSGSPPMPSTAADEERILQYVAGHGSINNTECRQLLDASMHHCWYLLHKLNESGQLKRRNDRRWSRYTLPP